MLPNPTPHKLPVFHAHRTSSAERPWPLTLLCSVGLLLLLWTWWHALTSGTARAFGPGYWVYLCATSGAFGVGLWGLFRLRVWALFVFPAALLIDTAVVFTMGELRAEVLAVEGALLALVFSQVRAFRRDPRSPPED